ncbi:MAG TPA: PAS domain S-box protein [Bacteroidota bacterium]|nr:PAS domain S-box protein [Bacteroidota bacterium]
MAKRLQRKKTIRKRVSRSTLHSPTPQDLSVLLNSLTDAAFSLNERWEFTYLSPKAQQYLSKLHRTGEKLIGKNIWEEFPDTKQLPAYELYHSAMQKHKPICFEQYYPPLDTWFETYLHPSPQRLDVYLYDITARKKAEEALRESEERYRLLVEHSPDAIAVHSDGVVVFVNTAAVKMMGASSADELVGKPALSFVHPDYHDLVKERLRNITQERKALPMAEEKFVRLDGTVIDVEVASIPISYRGKPAMQVVIRDITDRKRSETKLHDVLRFNEQIISAAGQGIVVYDTELRHVVWNTFMEHLTGISASEVLGKRAIEVFPYLREQGVYDLLLRTIAGESTKTGDLFFFIPQTGKSGWVMQHYVPHRNARGEIIGAIGVISDISEQKKIQESLLKSEERYRTFISQSTEGIYRFDLRKPMPTNLPMDEQVEYIYKHGYHAECNLAMAEMYGFSSPEELVGKTLADLLPLSDPMNFEYLRSFVRSQYRLMDAESHERDKNGNIRYFLNNVVGIVQNGYLTHVWGTQRDITEKKRAERALLQSEQRYRTLVDRINDGLLQVTNDDVVVFVNQQFCDLVGYTESELVGKVASDLFTDEHERSVILAKNELRKRGVADQYELQIKKKSGERIWVRISGAPVYDNEGNVIGSIGLHTDITQHKQSDQALRASEEKYRGLFEHVLDGVYQSTPDGRILSANAALVRMLGYESVEEFRSLDIASTFYADPEQRKQFSRQLEEQGELRNAELRLRRKDGSIITVLENARVVRNNSGTTLYYEGTLTNITELKKAQEAVAESEQKYRSLIEQSNDAIYLLFDGKFDVVNKKFCELLGVTQEEVRSPKFNFMELVAPESVPIIEERQRKVARGEEPPHRYEFTARARDGRLIPLEASVSYISYKGGTAVQGILRDITERKSAEEGLKQMLSLLQSTLESTADGILLVDHDGKIVSFNNRFAQMWRIPQEILDTGDDDQALAFVLDQLKDPEGFLSKVRELYAQPLAESFDVLEFKDGRVFERYSIPQLVEGKPMGRVWSFRDVTTRKQAEEALRQSEEKYRTLFEESKDVIYISSADGHFIDVNQAGVELFGYSTKEELLKADIARDLYINPDDRRVFRRLIEQNGYVRDLELTLQRKNGERIVALETSTAVRDEKNNIVAYRGIIRDMTERKKLEEQLRQAQKLQSIGTLAGGIAHDFNNILGIIIGYVSRLSRDKLSPERVNQSIDAISKAAERGAGLVRQLLTFARQTDVQLESVHLNSIVEEVARMIRETFPKSITLSLDLVHHLPSIVADSTQLHQALLNLCLNAKDAMPTGGQLTIATEVVDGKKLRTRTAKAVEDSYVCLRVSDTGTGMDSATQSRIFEPFFTTKRRGGGTGLGLAVVYGIVDSHRGFIDVASEVGQGTTFRLYFPNPQVDVKQLEKTSQTYHDIPGGSETVLVVEDEEMLLELLRSVLEGKGYRVLAARDGVEAIDRYRQHEREIAAVISDVGLPKMSGVESCVELKKINPAVKIILASGYLDPAVKHELAKVEAKEFIQKPYNPDEVLRRLRAIIDS